ncbi:MAG: penicillin-binding transpeptidase domain-containing protein [Bacilli bacterium]
MYILINMNKLNRKVNVLIIITIISFIYIFLSLFNIMVFNNKKYKDKLYKSNNNYYVGVLAPRGNIYDRNGILLVGNKKITVLSYDKNNHSTREEIRLANIISDNINIVVSPTKEEIKKYYVLKNYSLLDSIISKEIKESYKARKITYEEYFSYLSSLVTNEELSNITNKEKNAIGIYFLMNKDYNYSTKIIKKDLTVDEVAYINNNLSTLSGFSTGYVYERYYPYGSLFREFLGSIGPIPKEDISVDLYKGYSMNDVKGISFIEKEYEYFLKGQNELYKLSATKVKKIIKPMKKGNDIVLSIDINEQKSINDIIFNELIKAKSEPNTEFLNNAFCVIGNPTTGEIYSASSVNLVYSNNMYSYYESLSDLINYGVTPGSTVKGASHAVAYSQKAIDIGYKVEDSCLYVKNTPPKCSWMRLGVVDDIDALRLSSNYYQFLAAIKVAKGRYTPYSSLYLNRDAFNIYRKMYNSFGLGVKTGIDLPKEHIGVRGKDNFEGALLDYPIGQYETYTPLSMFQYINTLAVSGTRYKLNFLKEVYDDYESSNRKLIFKYNKVILNTVDVDKIYIDRIRLGLKEVLYRGTGRGHINLEYMPAGKTGTAETFYNGSNTLSSSFVGYAPYDDPIVSIFTSTPNVTNMKSSYKSLVNSKITYKIMENYYKIFKK